MIKCQQRSHVPLKEMGDVQNWTERMADDMHVVVDILKSIRGVDVNVEQQPGDAEAVAPSEA